MIASFVDTVGHDANVAHLIIDLRVKQQYLRNTA